MASENTTETTTRTNFYSKISIDNNELIPSNIVSLVMREWVFDVYPRLELSLLDDGLLTEVFSIKDNSVLSLTLASDPDFDDNPLEVEFNIIDITVDNIAGNKASMLGITGILKTNTFTIRNRSFPSSTSIDVIRQIASDMGLKFILGENLQTTDLMTWLQMNRSNYSMIYHILKRAYKDNDLLLCYGTIQNELVYTSLKTELDKKDSIPARYSIEKYTETNFKEDIDKETIWYNFYNIVNYSGYFNRKIGYGIDGSYYNGSINNDIEIIDNFHPLSQESFKSKSGNLVGAYNFPIFTDNIHDNYFKAKMQNDFYKSFFGLSLVLNINSIYPIRLFDKVDLHIDSLIEDEEDEVQSGEYVVCGITHSISKNSIYKKQISLHRNGNNKPNIEEKK